MVRGMTNLNWLEKYNEAYSITSPEKAYAILDFAAKFIYLSPGFTKLLALNKDDFIGKKWDEITVINLEAGKYIAQLAASVVGNRTKISCRFIYRSLTTNYNEYLEIHHSILLFKGAEKDAVLVELQLVPMTFQAKKFGEILDRFVNPKERHDKKPALKFKKPLLTQREQEVLFLLMLGYGYKKIALTLSKTSFKQIESSTISPIIRKQLFPKFNVCSVEELIKTALETNYFSRVPQSFIDVIDSVYFANI